MFIPSFLLLFEPAWLGQDPSVCFRYFWPEHFSISASQDLSRFFPAWSVRAAPGASYGTALGFYNTAQFVGSTVGGPLAGALANYPPDRTVLVTMVRRSRRLPDDGRYQAAGSRRNRTAITLLIMTPYRCACTGVCFCSAENARELSICDPRRGFIGWPGAAPPGKLHPSLTLKGSNPCDVTLAPHPAGVRPHQGRGNGQRGDPWAAGTKGVPLPTAIQC